MSDLIQVIIRYRKENRSNTVASVRSTPGVILMVGYHVDLNGSLCSSIHGNSFTFSRGGPSLCCVIFLHDTIKWLALHMFVRNMGMAILNASFLRVIIGQRFDVEI